MAVIMSPRAYTSEREHTPPYLCSGDIHTKVPFTLSLALDVAMEDPMWSLSLARPKSMSLGTMFASSSTFSGFTSRWMTRGL